LNLIGSDSIKIYRTFNVDPKEETVEIIFKKLEDYTQKKWGNGTLYIFYEETRI